MKRWVIILIVAGVLVAGVFGVQAYRQSQARQSIEDLQTEIIAKGDLTATVGATGSVRSNQTALLTFQTSGIVDFVHQSLGERVSAGEVLATLRRTSLSSQIILAEAELVSAKRALDDLLESDQASAAAQLALAQAEDLLKDAIYTLTVRQEGNRASSNTILAAEANLILANEEVDRAQQLYDHASGDAGKALALSNLIAAKQNRDSIQRNLNWYLGFPTEVEQALLDADVVLAEARLADAQRDWERVKDGPNLDDIRAAEARVAASEATLEMGLISAPFAGSITSIDVMVGDTISPGTPAFRIDDLSRLLVEVEVSEVDINLVALGQSVTLNFDAVLDQVYSGVVVEMGLIGISMQGVVSFPVTVEVIDADEAIKPGMTAAVYVIVEQIENVVLVPNRAVRVRDGERVVYLLVNGVMTPVPVVLGATSDLYSEVLEGDLKVGDEIILNPPSFMFEAGEPPGFMGGMGGM
ncbi:MAG TPA: efflux RND transporter periplasmic adaptor subunit [Anaerolineales bacterium]|nr:efflux RND transporter periplasmic adaptor subunit [Anaerolineales bacterium]